MSTLRDFFSSEADDCLRRIEAVIASPAGGDIDGAELLRVTRLLRGSAQMAGEDRVLKLARAFEATARALVSHVVSWDATLRDAAHATVDDLRVLVRGTEAEEAREARLAQALERLRLPGQIAAGDPPAHRPATSGAAQRTTPATPPAPQVAASPPATPPPAVSATPRPPSTDPFLATAAREVSGIVALLDEALPVLRREPRNRVPLKHLLRKQHPLLTSRRLSELPTVAVALRAVDEICRLIARRNEAVAGDWLAFFEAVGSVLAEAEKALLVGAVPEGSGTLRELERIRARLVGSADAPSPGAARTDTTPAHGTGAGAAAAGAAHVDPRPADATPIEEFFYRGEALLRRAEELRPAIDRGLEGDATAREALEELYDLIRQVMS